MADSSSDDLDQLLDSALEDFNDINLKPDKNSGNENGGNGESTAGVQGLGLGLGLPDLKAKKKGKQKTTAATVSRPVGLKASHASEALEKLRQQTREAVRGLESATATAGGSKGGEAGLGNSEAMVEEFVKQFEELTGSQDMESIVETMMHQLLSKDILQEPMKEIGGRYPKWLEEHKSRLNPEEYNRYHHQYDLILKLNEVYDKEPNNFTMIVDLMQKMQECGQPPSDIVQELAPDLDLNNLGQLFPELLESSSNCSIM